MSRITVLIAVIIMGLMASSAFAFSTIDQEQLSTLNSLAWPGALQVAQTFTPDISGCLDRVEIAIVPSAFDYSGRTCTIYGTLGGLPDITQLLGSVLVTPTPVFDVNIWASFDFSDSDIILTAGNTYAFIPEALDGAPLSVNGQLFADPYPNGELFVSSTLGSMWDPVSYSSQGDFAFRTWMQTVPDMQPVPEPATLSLFGLGLVGMAGLRRRRRQHRQLPTTSSNARS